MIQVFNLDNSTKTFEDKVRLSIQYLKAISQHDFYIPVLTNLKASQYPQVVMLAMDQGPLPSAPSLDCRVFDTMLNFKAGIPLQSSYLLL